MRAEWSRTQNGHGAAGPKQTRVKFTRAEGELRRAELRFVSLVVPKLVIGRAFPSVHLTSPCASPAEPYADSTIWWQHPLTLCTVKFFQSL